MQILEYIWGGGEIIHRLTPRLTQVSRARGISYIYDHHPTPVISSSLPARTWRAADSVSFFDHWIADAAPIFMEIRCSKKGPSSRHVFSIIFQPMAGISSTKFLFKLPSAPHLSLLSFVINFNFRLFDPIGNSNEDSCDSPSVKLG